MSPRIRPLEFPPPYDTILDGVLVFATLEETEETILRLENLRQRFLANSDKKGVEYCRQVALAGRRRSAMIAGNRRISAGKRLQKSEAARWFQIWIDTPEIFADWLALRKDSEEFRNLIARI
jgi:hypothetical protein